MQFERGDFFLSHSKEQVKQTFFLLFSTIAKDIIWTSFQMKSLDGAGYEYAQTQLALHVVLLFYEIQGYKILLLGLSCEEWGKLSLSET